MEKRRVLVVEDQALMGALLVDSLTAAGFTAECASDAVGALVATREFDPDAIILDIDLGCGPSGLDVGLVLHQTRPDVAVVYLTEKPDAVTAAGQALPAGAGFLLKQQVRHTASLVSALESVLADQPQMARQDPAALARLPGLDGRQLATLRMVAQGLTNAAIAARLGVSQSSVERRLMGLFRALGIQSHQDLNPRVEAARRYIAACGMPEP